MTLDLFLRLYATVALGIMVLVIFDWPFDVIRRALARGPQLHTDEFGNEWRIIQQHQTLGVYGSRKEAVKHMKESDRIRAFFHEMCSCPWCCGGHLAYLTLGAYAVVWGEASVLWYWPLLWFTASLSVALVKMAAER